MVRICGPNHRKGTLNLWFRRLKEQYTCIGHLPWREPAGQEIALGESVNVW